MPARVVIVHNDPDTLEPLAEALTSAGHFVAKFDDAMAAWEALRDARTVELLITRVRFGRGKPHGLGLVIHTRTRWPNVKVIFTGSPRSMEAVKHSAHGFVPTPVNVVEAVATVERVLA
jgi:DNA-binding NtrC family response regulator